MLVRVATLGAILALGATLTGCTVDDAMYYDQGYAQPAYGPNTVVMSPPPQPVYVRQCIRLCRHRNPNQMFILLCRAHNHSQRLTQLCHHRHSNLYSQK